MLKCLTFVLAVMCLNVLVTARSAGGQSYQQLTGDGYSADGSASSSSSSHNIWNDFSFMYRIYKQCAKEQMTVCLKVKLLAGLEKALHKSRELNLIDGVKFVSTDNKEANDSAPVITEKDIEASLSRSLQDKDDVLNSMLLRKAISFIKSHTLQVKFPETLDMERSLGESRKHKDKKGNSGAYIMIPLLLAGTFIPIAYGALAMLAGKALIVSKLALVLASIIGIKKLLSGGGHKESQHEVVVSSGGHGSGWGREFDLAYNAYAHPREEDELKQL